MLMSVKDSQEAALKEWFLRDDYHVTFWFHTDGRTHPIEIISGRPQALGLPNANAFSLKKIYEYVEKDNPLSEVQGEHIFVRRIKNSIEQCTSDLEIFLPLKGEITTWLQVHFEAKEGHDALLGRVIQMNQQTPPSVIHYQKAHQDALTKLFTRESLAKHFDTLTHTEGAYGLYVDLDGFKAFNDRFGHHAGDELLRRIAGAFIDHWEENALYYRLGGDEFFVYIFHHSPRELYERTQWLNRRITETAMAFKGVGMQASIGIIPLKNRTPNIYDVLDGSDAAMYAAKAHEDDNVCLSAGGTFIFGEAIKGTR